MNISPKQKNILYSTGLALLALLVFMYIFDSKIDINGDNCYYFAFASSVAVGEGYCDMMGEPTSLFPPGYPLLMVPLRLVTDSVVAQKILNLLFLLVATMMLYFLLLAEEVRRSVAFVACAAVLLTAHVLEFSTMMMSEASCILFMVLAVFAYRRLPDGGAIAWRSPWLYLFLFAVPYAFLIRTQAVVLVVAFLLVLLLGRRFKLALLLFASFVLCYAPWAVRNSLLELGQSRYVSQIDFSNIYGNVCMLLVQALPESVVPFFDVKYALAPTPLLWVIAMLMLATVMFGFWRMKKIGLLLALLFVGNVGIVSIMNTPSYYRYTVILLPFVTVGMLCGLWGVGCAVSKRLFKRSFSPLFLLLLFVPSLFYMGDKTKHSIFGLNKISNLNYMPSIANYLKVGRVLSKQKDARVVLSRKPELLFAHSGVKGKRYKEGTNNVQIVKDLLMDNADYIILDNLGFKYSYEVLYPFIMEHERLFDIVYVTPEPVNVLFRFKKKEAYEWLMNGVKIPAEEQ